MQGDRQPKAMLNGWLGMQEKMLKDWWDVVAKPGQNGRGAAPPATLWELWSQWPAQGFEEWQALYQQNMAAFSQQLLPEVTNNVMTQFLSGQNQAQQLTKLVTEAWQAMLANTTSPAEWQAALITFTDQLRQQLLTTMTSANLMENSAELWRLYYEEAQKFAQPWLSAWWQTPTFMSKGGNTERSESVNDLMQLYQAAFEQTIGRALLAPSMGLLREFNEKVNKGFALWLENQQTQMAYQRLVGEAWIDAFQAFMQKLVAMAQKGETIADQRHLLRIWVEVADEIFVALFHTEAYAKVQSAYVNSNMALRRQQRELLEVWLRTNDMPTRSDVDEAHQQIYQLRKEVKALKKAQTESAANAASTTPATTRKSTASASNRRSPSKSTKAKTKATAAAADANQSSQEGAA